MKQNLGTLTSKGWNQYTDSRGRTIVYVPKTKSGYIIAKEEEKKLMLLSNRYALAVTVLFLLGFYTNWYYGIAAGVVILAGCEYYYRAKFLPSQQEVSDVVVPAKLGMIERMMQRKMSTNIVFAVASIALAVLLVINAINEIDDWSAIWQFKNINDVLLVAVSALVAVYALYGCCCAVIAIIRMRQEKAVAGPNERKN